MPGAIKSKEAAGQMTNSNPTSCTENKKGKPYGKELSSILGKEAALARKGYDVLGNIAIIDADPKAAKAAARLILSTHKNITTILRKAGAISGKYRKRKYIYVLGKRNYTARYTENGSTFTFDVRAAFFSSRLAYERKRICSLVGEHERVFVMFAGVGPFAIEIAKSHKQSVVVALELNRAAFKYLVKNISMNKTANVVPVLGDALAPPKEYEGFASRIIMPHPTDSIRFFGAALKVSGPRCNIHLYLFTEDGGAAAELELKRIAASMGFSLNILSKRVVRTYSARISEIVIDMKVRK